MSQEVEKLALGDAVTHLLEECRMVLPGVQALFGFQLIAVFNAGFGDKLTGAEQRLHLVALALVAMAGALIMTPAALHRLSGPRLASERFLIVASRFLLASMLPLMLGMGFDFYLIARIVLESAPHAAMAATALVGFFAACWFLFPLAYRRQVHKG